MTEPLFFVLDMFCGAGGTSTGFALSKYAEVIAAVNHDPIAIRSHWRNHPNVIHFEEDIRTLNLDELVKLVQYHRTKYPNAYFIIWLSLECTNFSKAKGGQPREADSRTLADDTTRYIEVLKPDYVQIENVVEFMSWGPLDTNGKPISRKNGSDWLRWRKKVCSYGYYDEWKEMNSANYGAYTSRNRLFGIFAKHGLPIAWPEPTHAKNPSKFGIHGDLLKWKPVKDVLDFQDEGESIFTRKKELSDKTLERIYAGLLKYVAKGNNAFISKYFSGKAKSMVSSTEEPGPTLRTKDGQALVQTKAFSDLSVDQPAGAITTKDHHALIQSQFLTHYYGNGFSSSIDEPCPTVTTKDRSGLVQPEFLVNYNHSSETNDINDPAPTLVTRDKIAKVKPVCLLKYDSTDKTGKHYPPSLEQPAPVIITQGRLGLIQAEHLRCEPFIMPTNYDNQPKSVDEPLQTITANRKHHYIVNPSHGGHSTSTDAPCPVIVARQDKAPLYLVQCEQGVVQVAVYESDSAIMIRIKEFMVAYNLIDIKMRMLRVGELLKIQGFPEGYMLEGNQSDQKKFIGNSVVPHVVKAWTEAMAMKLIDNGKLKVA